MIRRWSRPEDKHGLAGMGLLASSRDTLDQMYDGVCLVDRERRIHFWDRGAARLLRYSSAEVVGTRCSDNVLIESGTCLSVTTSVGGTLARTGEPMAKTVRCTDELLPRSRSAGRNQGRFA